jgi:predicted small lipoprotein YifL
MIKILIVMIIILLLSNCGKKGELYLENKDSEDIIQIDEDRIYKF